MPIFSKIFSVSSVWPLGNFFRKPQYIFVCVFIALKILSSSQMFFSDDQIQSSGLCTLFSISLSCIKGVEEGERCLCKISLILESQGKLAWA